MGSSRIVLVMVDPPLPFGKAMGRWYSVLLRGLVERGHRVTAFATCTTSDEAARARSLFPAPEFDLRCHVSPTRRGLRGKWATLRQPYSYVFHPELRRELQEVLAGGFDLLHLETLWAGWLGLEHPGRTIVGVPYLFQVDLADRPATTTAERWRRRLGFHAERRLLRHYRHLIAVSPRLAETIRRIAPRANVHVLPFGMDLARYPFLEDRSATRDPTLGLIASFNWTPGVTAGERLLTRLWPEIQRRVPRVRLHLAGVAGRTAFARHLGRPGVTIDDYVDDVTAFFRGIDLQLYAPNDSSGMKYKVLESFAFGVPLVTNAAGVEGIPALDGVHAGICEDDTGLVERTVALLVDPERRQRQRLAARALLEAHCGPEVVLDQLEEIYRTVLVGGMAR